LDVIMAARLDFEAPDADRFPCLRLAREACEIGGTASAVLNAANEVAVDSFLAGQLGFTGIPELVEAVMAQSDFFEPDDIAAVKAADREARRVAHQQLVALSA
jgi:1-deoxy-D-xylulose-5-phosphate reductoisomerase